jgi:hypothetical protein
MRGRQGRHAAWLLLGCLLLPARARASYEEFSTVNVGRTEEDDEYLFDSELVRSPFYWHDEYDHATNAFRASQGCFTAGQWHIDNNLKFTVPLGDTARFTLDYLDYADMESVYGWTRLEARFPIAHTGTWGYRYTPSFDKSRQDMALLWEHGNAFTPLQLQGVFTLEDVFNNFWSQRQVKVGGEPEPYLRHPYEPALSVTWRGGGPKFSANAKWLTPSTKHFETKEPELRRTEKLWGAKGNAVVSQTIARTTVEAAFEMVQASSYGYWEQQAGDHHQFARRWRIKGSLIQDFGDDAHVAVRYYYMDRTQVWRPPVANSTLNVIDRCVMIDSWFKAPWGLGARAGALRDRVTSWHDGGIYGIPGFDSPGTRYETRAIISLHKMFGKVRLQGIEGIELDKEPYPVSFHHDKGFLQLQTTF